MSFYRSTMFASFLVNSQKQNENETVAVAAHSYRSELSIRICSRMSGDGNTEFES